jgi:hypothetical protein
VLTGSCLCGAVRFTVSGKLGPVIHCHCESCRKAQGGAFVTNAPVRRKYLTLVTGADSVAAYESSPGKQRTFCRTCGSPLWSERRDAPDVVRLRLGLLDGDPGRRPAAHIWVGEKAPWFEITDDLPRSATDGTELERQLPSRAR